jgi:hypothetical protein
MMADDKPADKPQKPTAGAAPPAPPGEAPAPPPREKLKLVTTEEERLAAEIEKLRK